MEHHAFEIGGIVIIAVLAFSVPLVLSRFKRLRIPIVVGEILAGAVVGKSGLNLVHVDEVLSFLNFLGLAYLMFVSGLEVNFAALGGGNKEGIRGGWVARLYQPVVLAFLFLGLTLFGAYEFSVWTQGQGLVRDARIFALIMATSALGLVVPVLKERQVLDKALGQTVLTTAVVADFVPVLLLSVAVSLFKGGSLSEVALLGVLLAAVVIIYMVARRLGQTGILEGLTGGTAQIGVRGAFALMLVLLLITQYLNLEVILGAFLAGLVISALLGPRRQDLTHKLDAMGFGFLIPIFFVMVGVQFDYTRLVADPGALLFVPVLLGATLLVKAVPALLLILWHPWREALGGAMLSATQMSVTIAAALLAESVGAITPAMTAAVILVAVLTSIIGPLVFNLLMPPGQAEPAARHAVVITGANRYAGILAQRIANHGLPVTVVDRDPAKILEIHHPGVTRLPGDVTSAGDLRKAGVDRARLVIAITGSDEVNLATARAARELKPDQLVVVINNSQLAEQARGEGFQVISPELALIDLLESLAVNPESTSLVTAPGGLALRDVRLQNMDYVGRSLRHAELPGDILVVSVMRNGEKLIPHGDTVLSYGDLLTIVAPQDDSEQVARLLGG